MRPVKIITDSCADIGGDILEKYDIDYARMNTRYEGKETTASLTWEFYSPSELYGIMRKGDRVLTTQVPAEEFKRVFTMYLEQGYDIVYVGCSLKQSGSVNTGAIVAKELLPQYEGAQIYCINSLNACVGEGMLAIRAAEYRDQGLSAAEINDRVTADRNLVREYVTVHTLDWLKKAGRVKATSAFFGNLMGVKPIIISDAVGDQFAVKKVKGRSKSLQEIVSMLAETITDAENQTVYIAHADCPEDAETLKQMVMEKIPCRDVVVGYIGPIVGSSIGPDAIGVFAFGEEVTLNA